MLKRFFPDLQTYGLAALRADVGSGLAVTFMGVPAGIAYAMIAGLPPAAGLFASAIPTVLGSLLRSSSHVIAGPTNALSLLVGTAVAASTASNPIEAALMLAVMVGAFQVAAGLLKLGAIVDYISSSVVAGYITGAGVLIGIGQLENLTGTEGARGNVYTQISAWIEGLGALHWPTLVLGLGTAAGILLLRLLPIKVPTAILALGAGVALSYFLGLDAYGVALARDIAPVPVGFPPLTVPALDAFHTELIPIAIAATVLSLVESSSVARSIASRTGQRLSSDQEFFGQGVANLAAGFFGGYPTSGSLSRSALNERAGARTRISGVVSGLLMVVVLLFLGPIVDLTPIASLAGLLLVIAIDLVDINKIRAILAGDLGDKLAFGTTMIATWVVPLDQAIYLGVGISLVMFLRRARQLVIKEMILDDGRFREAGPQDDDGQLGPIRILHVEGSLFFGAASELADGIEDAIADPQVQVLIVRLKRAQGLDYTTASVLEAAHTRLEHEGRHLLLVGMRADAMRLLERVGVADRVGPDALYPTRPTWFAAMDQAIADAMELAGAQVPEPLETYVEQRQEPETPEQER